jgi:protein-tyrosine-phosphatase
MAEGLLQVRGGMDYQAFSAGTHPWAIHLLEVKAMAELDIDISERAEHPVKGIEEDGFLARENDVTPYEQAHNAGILLGLCKANPIKSAI